LVISGNSELQGIAEEYAFRRTANGHGCREKGTDTWPQNSEGLFKRAGFRTGSGVASDPGSGTNGHDDQGRYSDTTQRLQAAKTETCLREWEYTRGRIILARYKESACHICRAEGVKLFLKGDRCYTDKCAFERRGYAPGEHGQSRKKKSDFGIQLREKQKLKRSYGLLEKAFRKYYQEANRQKGVTGTNLLILLERRLDNMVYRMGFASSRDEARQLVRHGHFEVNGKKVNIPSYLVKTDDSITVKEKSRKILAIREAMDTVARRGVPEWLEVDANTFTGQVKAMPLREQLTMPFEEQLVVEFYSK